MCNDIVDGSTVHGVANDVLCTTLDPLGGERFKGHPLWNVMASALDYTVSWREFVGRPIHINVLELRAFLREERRVAARHRSVRVLSGLDSQVALGAIVKGRSSSRALNNEMRRFLGPALGSDIYGLHMYYDTALNPADDPTRQREVRPASEEKPHWWDSVKEGCTFELEQWLRRHGAPADFVGVDLGELCGKEDVDLRPQKLVRANSVERRKSQKPRSTGPVSDERSELKPERATATCPFGPEALSILRSFKRNQFFCKDDGEPDITKAGALDLFSGRAGVARQMVKLGAPWVLTFDWKRCPSEDLLDAGLRSKIELLISSGAVLSLGAAPICSSFSVEVTPPVRSSRFPRGMPGLRRSMRLKVRQGNAHNDWLADLLTLCERHHVFWWVENPDTSWWWRQKRWRRYRDSRSSALFRLCFCRFGCRWKKATRIATNTTLGGIRMWCQCARPHSPSASWHMPREEAAVDTDSRTIPAGSLHDASCRGDNLCWLDKERPVECCSLCQNRNASCRRSSKAGAPAKKIDAAIFFRGGEYSKCSHHSNPKPSTSAVL